MIAEISKICLGEKKFHMKRMLLDECGGNFYMFLCQMSDRFAAKGKMIGACTEPRHSPTSQNSTHDWDKRRDMVLSAIKKHFHEVRSFDGSNSQIVYGCRAFIDELANSADFPNVSRFLAVQFMQMSSLIGISPLVCYNFASISDIKQGSADFIRVALRDSKATTQSCSKAFEALFNDIQNVWEDGKVNRSLIENTLCELHRSYWPTALKLVLVPNKPSMKVFKKWAVSRLPSVRCIMNNDERVESSAQDVYYYMHHRDKIQNFYRVRISGEGATSLKPQLVMVTHPNIGQRSKVIRVTNWKKDAHDKGLLKWSQRGKAMKLDSNLIISKAMKAHF